jgi:hypothetical protein
MMIYDGQTDKVIYIGWRFNIQWNRFCSERYPTLLLRLDSIRPKDNEIGLIWLHLHLERYPTFLHDLTSNIHLAENYILFDGYNYIKKKV